MPPDVKVTRQVLAEPSADLGRAHLGDAGRRHAAGDRGDAGAGRIVLFHVTANADWSNLPLSGLFVEMLRRLVALSAGVATPPRATPCWRRPRRWTGYGLLTTPPDVGDRPGGRRVRRDRRPRRAIRPGCTGRRTAGSALNLGAATCRCRRPPRWCRARAIEQFGRARCRSGRSGPWLLAAGAGAAGARPADRAGAARPAAPAHGRGRTAALLAAAAGRHVAIGTTPGRWTPAPIRRWPRGWAIS